jgi:hypothetical protein
VLKFGAINFDDGILVAEKSFSRRLYDARFAGTCGT